MIAMGFFGAYYKYKFYKAMKKVPVELILINRKNEIHSLSAQRRAAAVSVVKNGLPVPAANITTLPFSKCLTALLLMYGSATSDMRNAVWTRVGIPMLSIVACKNIAFITVANMLNTAKFF